MTTTTRAVTLRTIGWMVLLAGETTAQVTQLVSIGTDGQPRSGEKPALSADGRYIAFANTNLFLRDRSIGTTTVVSSAAACHEPSISADGRYIAYSIENWGLFVFDRVTGATDRASVDSSGNLANGFCASPEISSDGRFVAFHSTATNLAPGDANGKCDVFVHDRQSGTTELVSITTAGIQGNDVSAYPSISADGRFVAFLSIATNLVGGDSNSAPDIFVRDLQLGTTERVTAGMPGSNWDTIWHGPSISGDGRFVAFEWGDCDVCGGYEVFVSDRLLGVTEQASVNSAGSTANDSSFNPYISSDGRYVLFESDATNLVPPDPNGSTDVFIHDRRNHRTERMSVDSRGRRGNAASGGFDSHAGHNLISSDGRFVGFQSNATNLVPEGGSDSGASYVHDRAHGEYATSCEPGVSGVIDCPCGNRPSGRGRGCDNSVGTGGARLTVGGGEYLSSDSLYIDLSEARPRTLSIVMQATRRNASGVVFGQGIRCIGGIQIPLWITTTGQDGAMTVPDFGSGDPTVHRRSAELGFPILPMDTLWYMALYRDPVVLGGCPASATFNSTQSKEILWLP